VRAIWDFVGHLDLGQYYGEIDAVEGEAGRPAWDPRLMISLWVYAYSKGVSSGREIGRLCETDPAYQWLTGLGAVNYHTLCDFRVAHQKALDELFTQVLGLLSAEGLVTLERVMHDGTKVKACASGDTFRREERIGAHLEKAREQVKQMGDPRVAEEVGPRVTKARQRAAREKQERLEKALEELEKIRGTKTGKEDKEQVRVSMTDPEARIMKQGGGGGYGPSYNLQLSTDEANKVIVGVGVTQSGTDYGELEEAEERIERNMGRAPGEMVVDGGFVSRSNILAMEKRGVGLIGPLEEGVAQSAGQMKRRGVEEGFRPDRFGYDAQQDTYWCPAGKALRLEGKEKRIGKVNYQYRARVEDCQTCCHKMRCCPQNESKGRAIVRGVDAPEVVSYIAKMKTEEAKAIYKRRGEVAEFPNAWLKDKIGLRQFRLRGLLKVGIEAMWACLTYNIQQWIRLCWRPHFA
jgi:transposase